MRSFTQEELVQIALRHYPTGYPVETDDYAEPVLAYQRTPEYQRWMAAWNRAMAWPECDTLLEEVQAAFPTHHVARFTQPRMVACIYCIIAMRETSPEGSPILRRVVGAISVLAPLYLVYVTTEPFGPTAAGSRPQVTHRPEGALKPHAEKLAQLIERYLGYSPFSVELADVALPGLRVDFLHGEQPTLLTALFANRMDNLP